MTAIIVQDSVERYEILCRPISIPELYTHMASFRECFSVITNTRAVFAFEKTLLPPWSLLIRRDGKPPTQLSALSRLCRIEKEGQRPEAKKLSDIAHLLSRKVHRMRRLRVPNAFIQFASLSMVVLLTGSIKSRAQSVTSQGANRVQTEQSLMRSVSGMEEPLTDRANSTFAHAGRYGQLPLSFEANHGQMDSHARYMSRGLGYSLFLTDNEAVLVLDKGNLGRGNSDQRPTHGKISQPTANDRKTDLLRMMLVGASPGLHVEGNDQLPGTINYFIGNDPAKWHTKVPTYGSVKYLNVYPGVDLVYHGDDRQLEYDFIVAPGINPASIGVRFTGAKSLMLDRQGDLRIEVAGGVVTFRKPVVYQKLRNRKVLIPGRFALLANHCIGFRVGHYNRTLPLVIDPTLAYSSYLGGSTNAIGYGVAVDASGSAYVTGQTFDTDFPDTSGFAQPKTNGAAGIPNAFIAKFNPGGTTLIYSTYLGGNGDGSGDGDGGTSIAVDASGNAYVSGTTTSRNFPVVNPYLANNPSTSGSTPFVAKLDSTGTKLIYSTYLGGSGNESGDGDVAYHIEVNSAGNAFVTGATYSQDFPTQNPIQSTNQSYGNSGSNAFVSELNPSGNGLVFSTYLGGTGITSPSGSDSDNGDTATGIALGASGNVYITGIANSTDFPLTTGSYQQSNNAKNNQTSNAFVAALSSTGSKLIYSTYLGGSGVGDPNSGSEVGDYATGVAVDSVGNAYITGAAFSQDFPVSSTAYQAKNLAASASLSNAFVTKLDPTGSILLYSTYLGGSGGALDGITTFGDFAYDITLDAAGNAYVTGLATSANFPVTPGAYQSQNNSAGTSDNAFVTGINSDGTGLLYSTYLGGTGLSYTAYAGAPTFYFGDYALAIAADQSENLYVTGQACSHNFPVAGTPFQKTSNSKTATGCNAFASKISLTSSPVLTPTTTGLVSDGNPQTSGKTVTFTTYVQSNSGSGTPTGQVIFSVDGTAVSTVPLNATGHAVYATGSLSPGQHTVAANYSGDTAFSPSSANILETIIGPPANITIVSGANQTVPYGSSFDLSVMVTDTNGRAVAGVTLAYTGAGLQFSSASVITDTLGLASVTATSNTSGSFTATATATGIAKTVTFSLTVTKVPLTVTATNVTVQYGQAIPALTYTVSGFVNGDTSSVLSGSPAESTTAKPTSAPGTYPITISQGSLTSANYSFTFVNGVLTIARPTPLPSLSVSGGTYNSVQTITLSDSAPGAILYYTTDGSTPTTSSTRYTGPISVTSSETITVIAIAPGYQVSSPISATYQLQVATPSFLPGPGTYSSAQQVSITDTTPGANIFFTLNGSQPTTSSTRYAGPVSVTSSETINAVAVATGFQPSGTGTATYTLQTAIPSFSPAPGTYTSAQAVTISDSNPGATIHYTTDGSTPTMSSPQYSGPIAVTSSETINAIAIAPPLPQSGVASGKFMIVAPQVYTAYGSPFIEGAAAPAIQIKQDVSDQCPGNVGLISPDTTFDTYTSVLSPLTNRQTFYNVYVKENFFPLDRVSPGRWIPSSATYTGSPSLGGIGFVFSDAFNQNATSTYNLALTGSGLVNVEEAGSEVMNDTARLPFDIASPSVTGKANWTGKEVLDLNSGSDQWSFTASFNGSYVIETHPGTITCSLNVTLAAKANNVISIELLPVLNPTPPPVVPPPSLLTLANLSNNVYSGSAGYEGYRAITLQNGAIANSCNVLGLAACEYNGFQAVAYETSDESQIVIAYRGTDLVDDPFTSIKNILADKSFKGTTPSADLTKCVTYAALFLRYIQDNFPGATVTLTGHSLGGAIAELIGAASGLTTDSFNAPGGEQLYTPLLNALQPIVSAFKSGDGITNYRIFGDQVSLFGVPIGTQVTLPPTTATTFTTGGTLGESVVAHLDEIGNAHAMSPTMITQVTNLSTGVIQPIANCATTPCPGEPNFAEAILKTLQPMATVIPSQTEVLYQFLFSVLQGTGYLIDPPGGSVFNLMANSGSPVFTSLELPSLSGVGSYGLRFKTSHGWSKIEFIKPGSMKVFREAVDDIEFTPLKDKCDKHGHFMRGKSFGHSDQHQPAVISGPLLFYATYSRDGQFAGTLGIKRY
jgi:hypothetical protein